MARWIVSPRFDLIWFFGGAALSLALAALVFAAHVPVLAVRWLCILCLLRVALLHLPLALREGGP